MTLTYRCSVLAWSLSVLLLGCVTEQDLGDPVGTEGASSGQTSGAPEPSSGPGSSGVGMDTTGEDDSTGGTGGEVECSDDGCFTSCVRRFSPPGVPEICSEPAEEHPSWACELAASCPQLIVGSDVEPNLEAAECVLTALRDGTPGALRVTSASAEIDFYVLSDGTALVDALGPVASSCIGMQAVSSIGAIALRPSDDPYWQECLDANSGAALEDCFFDLPEDITGFLEGPMPWRTEACMPASAACDG